MDKNPAFSQKKNDTRHLNNVAAAFLCRQTEVGGARAEPEIKRR